MLEQLTSLVTYLVIVSVAAERLTDITKRALIQQYNLTTLNGAIYQIIAGVFGAVICQINPPELTIIELNHYVLLIVIGLAVSGGSGAWNTILSILKELSKAKNEIDQSKTV